MNNIEKFDAGDYVETMSTSIVFPSGWVLSNIVLLRLNKFVLGNIALFDYNSGTEHLSKVNRSTEIRQLALGIISSVQVMDSSGKC